MNSDELEDYYLSKKQEGMDFSEIRKELHSRKISDENIRILIRSIDHKILQEENNTILKIQGNESFVIGLFLLIGGLVISLGSWTGLINLGGYAIIAVGPIIGGFGLIAGSKLSKARKNMRSKRFGRSEK